MEKVREDPEFKLAQLEKLVREYESKKFIVIHVSKVRNILGK